LLNVKVAIAIDDTGGISEHFGQSAQFLVVELESGELVGHETRDNPHLAAGEGRRSGCAHRHGRGHAHGRGRGLGLDRPCDSGTRGHLWIQKTLGDCDAVIARGIGAGALAALNAAGIRVLHGKATEKIATPREALELLLRGTELWQAICP
jgi:predicted Fe-Mo cluster-binding NifX family protein